MTLYGLLSAINQFAYNDDFTVEYRRKSLKVGGILRDCWCLSTQTRLDGGERGIRTPDTLLTYTRFPGVLFQPLRHLSAGDAESITTRV